MSNVIILIQGVNTIKNFVLDKIRTSQMFAYLKLFFGLANAYV